MSVLINDDMHPFIGYIIFRRCTPSWEMEENTLGGINLTYIIQGAACYTVDGEEIELQQGDLLVLPEGCVRKAITFPDRLMQCFSVDFKLKTIGNQELPPPLPSKSHPGCHEDIIHLFHELFSAYVNKQPGYNIKSNGLFLQILYRFLEIVVYKTSLYTGDHRISKVTSYINMHYSEHITIKMMAEMVRLHPTYFGVLFRQTMGKSFNQYLLQTRVKHAEYMLKLGKYKVNDVSESCGFSDISHFNKQFKQIMGFPPSHCIPGKF
ncbi:AraC family transcriptional regulator [Treponema sp. R80B11-R83G3]